MNFKNDQIVIITSFETLSKKKKKDNRVGSLADEKYKNDLFFFFKKCSFIDNFFEKYLHKIKNK